MVRADVMEDARNRSAHTIIETLGGIGMDRAASIFAFGVPDCIVGGEGFTDGQNPASSAPTAKLVFEALAKR